QLHASSLSILSLHDALPISAVEKHVGAAQDPALAASGGDDRSRRAVAFDAHDGQARVICRLKGQPAWQRQGQEHKSEESLHGRRDRKSTRLNSSHQIISYAV